jgi:hypothetical protein
VAVLAAGEHFIVVDAGSVTAEGGVRFTLVQL